MRLESVWRRRPGPLRCSAWLFASCLVAGCAETTIRAPVPTRPTKLVVASESNTDFGWNGGIGVTFELASGSQFYLEAKYHSIDTSPAKTEYIPITFGYRW